MKKFVNYGLSLVLIASLFLVSSCGETEPVEPEFSVPSLLITGAPAADETTVDVGETVSFKVNVTAPAGFNTIYYNKTVGSETTTRLEEESRPSGTAPTTFEYNFTYTATEADAGKEIVFDFVAVDEKDKEGQVTYTVNVNDRKVNAFPATLLFAPDAEGRTKTFFSADNGNSYSTNDVTGTAAQVSPLLDFGYFYGTDVYGASLASPAEYPIEIGQKNWSVRNNTLLKKTDVSVSAFNESNAAFIEAAFEAASFGAHGKQGQVRGLAADDVIAFETAATKEGGSKRGLIRILEIKPGTGNKDYIKIEVRIIE